MPDKFIAALTLMRDLWPHQADPDLAVRDPESHFEAHLLRLRFFACLAPAPAP